MASTASCSGNKWVKYCLENATEVSNVAETLTPNDGPVSMGNMGISEVQLKELKQHLKSIPSFKTADEKSLHRVCEFIAGRVKTTETPTASGAPGSKKATTGPKKEYIQKRGTSFYCFYCYAYNNPRKDRLRGHVLKCAKGPDNEDRAAVFEKKMEEVNIAKDNWGKNSVFNPRSFTKDFYSKSDVFNILINFGHYAVPEDREATCDLEQVQNNITGRTWPREAQVIERQVAVKEDIPQEPTTKDNPITTGGEGNAPEPTEDTTQAPGNALPAEDLQLQELDHCIEEKVQGLFDEAMDDNTNKEEAAEEEENAVLNRRRRRACRKIVFTLPVDDEEEEEEEDNKPTQEKVNEEVVGEPDKEEEDEGAEQEQENSYGASPVVSPYKERKSSSPRDPSSPGYGRKGIKYQYQGGLKLKLKQEKFYDLPKEYAALPVWKEVTEFLQTKAIEGANLKNHLANMQRFCWKLGTGKLEVSTKDLTQSNIKIVFEFMRENKMNYQTLINYYKSLKLLFSYYSSFSSLYETDREEHARLNHVLEYCQTYSSGLSKNALRQYREKVVMEANVPSVAYIHEMVGKFRTDATKQLKRLVLYPDTLNRDLVAHLNRYVASEICFIQGHRPGVLEHWMSQSYTMGTSDAKCKFNVKGETMFVCPVTEHKTASFYIPQIVLHSSLAEFMKLYIVHVRDPIVRRTNSPCENVLLQYDGKPFVKITQGLVDLQRKHDVANPINVSTARKAIETDSKSLTGQSQSLICKFLCHSEQTRDKVYRKINFVDAAKALGEMISRYGGDAATETKESARTAACTPKKARRAPSDSDSDPEVMETPKKARKCSKDQEARSAAKLQTASVSTPPKQVKDSLQAKEDVQGPSEDKTPQKEGRTAEIRSPPSAGKQRVMKSLIEKYGNMADAKIPSASELSKHHGIKAEKKNLVNRALHWEREKAICKDAANWMVARLSRRFGIAIHDLLMPMVEANIPKQFPDSVSRGKKINKATLLNLTKHIIAEHRNEQVRTNVPYEDIKERIKTQKWPNLQVSNTELRGRGVFSGLDMIHKGQILCDYHGEMVSRVEGQKRLAAYSDGDSDGNYFLFFKIDGVSVCVDAATVPCPCHPDLPTTLGRLINHSASSPNVQPEVRRIGEKNVVVMVAIKNIPPFTELFYDYGVRRAEDGSKLDWLQK